MDDFHEFSSVDYDDGMSGTVDGMSSRFTRFMLYRK